jgi:hypothetical protein
MLYAADIVHITAHSFFTFGIMKDLSRTIPHEKFEQMSPDKIMRYSALFLEN